MVVSNMRKSISWIFNRRTLLSIVLIFLVIPGTVIAALVLFDQNRGQNRYYFIVSLLMILYILVPFFMVFEKRKPQARELILIAVLTALAVVGRWVFFWAPQFKPTAAIVILTGACLGPEAGFLTGALSMFVSNFTFGQGPNTPWQMAGMGVLGFLAGLLFYKDFLPKKRLPLCLYGGPAAMMIYGLWVDLGTAMLAAQGFSLGMWLTTILSGIVFNVIHGVATVVFLLLFSGAMVDILERIKRKYGLIEVRDG